MFIIRGIKSNKIARNDDGLQMIFADRREARVAMSTLNSYTNIIQDTPEFQPNFKLTRVKRFPKKYVLTAYEKYCTIEN